MYSCLQIVTMPHIQYLQIKTVSHVQCLQIITMPHVQYLQIKTPSHVQCLQIVTTVTVSLVQCIQIVRMAHVQCLQIRIACNAAPPAKSKNGLKFLGTPVNFCKNAF